MSMMRRVRRMVLVILRWCFYRARFLGREVTVHPTSRVSWRARLSTAGGGSITIGRYCEIHRDTMLLTYGGAIAIGDECSLNPYAILYGHGGLKIGCGVRIAAQTIVIPANHQGGSDTLQGMRKPVIGKGIEIGDFAWLGAGVRVLDGVRVGRHAVIGAGSVVTHDVADGMKVGGVPARPLKSP